MNRFANSTRGKNKHPQLRAAILPVLLGIVLMLFFGFGIASVSRTAEMEQMRSTKQAVIRAAVHCYASEGIYPPSLAALEERYGLQLDHESYIIGYERFASNMLPQVTVLPKAANFEGASS